MKQKSIYQNQCPQLRDLFAQAPLERILIVAVDFARDQHMALICDGLGQQLLKPFAVRNNLEGVDFLNERIRTTCKRHGIKAQHVFLGGEDDPPYALNFLWALHAHWLVVRVNAFMAKKQRENLQASTDKLDLLGIAKMLLNRQASLVFGPSDQDEPASMLNILGRDRDALVRDLTRLGNRIHAHVKILFARFLTEEKDNPIRPLSSASLSLMEREDFNAGAYARKQTAPLARTLKKLRLRLPQDKAANLIARAKAALRPPPHLIASHQCALRVLVGAYRSLQQAASQLEREQARLLATNPAAMLTSLPGVGIISASALAGELGPAERLRRRGSMCSYAGVIPRLDQTGGPESPAQTKSVGHRCNHRLKNHLVRTAMAIGQRLGPPEIRLQYQRLMEGGQHAPFIFARKLLGIAKALMQKRVIWLPHNLRKGAGDAELSPGQYRQEMYEHLLEHWPKLCAKWTAQQLLEDAFTSGNPLGQWREALQQLYRMQLPLRGLPILLEDTAPAQPASHDAS